MENAVRDSPWGVLIAGTAVTMTNGLLPLQNAVKEENRRLFSSLALPASSPLEKIHQSNAATCPANPNCISDASLSTPAPAAEVSTLMRLLDSIYGKNEGQSPLVLPLINESVTVGRMPSNDFRVVNPCISSVHCRFFITRLTHTKPNERNEDDQSLLHLQSRKTYEKEGPKETSSPGVSACCTSSGSSLVTVADLSRNSCSVNGKPVGKGKSYRGLKSGDTIVLLDAGSRTREYNVQFFFFFWADFHFFLLQTSLFSRCFSDTAIPVNSPASVHKLSHLKEKSIVEKQPGQEKLVERNSNPIGQRNEKKKRIMLLSAWNAAAQVQRMHAHAVEDFYVLDKACPLGEGAFGKVYRAALRPLPLHLLQVDSTTCLPSTSSSTHTGHKANQEKKTDAERLSKEKKELVLFPPLSSPFSFLSDWNEAEIRRQREAYVSRKELFPSLDISLANESMMREMIAMHVPLKCRKRERDEEGTELSAERNKSIEKGMQSDYQSSSKDALPYGFAVKIVGKRHLWLDDSSDSVNMVWGSTRVPISAEEQPALLELIELGTPSEEYKDQREEYFFQNELRQALSSLSSSSLLSQDTATSGQIVDRERGNGKENNCLDSNVREEKRNRCLQQLSPQARQLYHRARRSSERLKCEVSILISVQHPNVVRLYEVFDNGKELALVMEQATGGDVWDLLQPAKQAPSHGKMINDGQLGYHLHEGGPLPEFIVKIIIVQVLEAVLYLHSMGVIHRDLKLENLLLQRPINVGQLVRSQCEMLLHKLCHLVAHIRKEKKEYETLLASLSTFSSRAMPSSTEDSSSCTSPLYQRGVPQCNPLSPLYAVHVPRRMWPVVKVTDFGLSRMLETSSSWSGMKQKGKMREDQGLDIMYATNQFRTSCGTSHYSAPEILHNELRPNKIGYSAAADMFSIGVIAFALLTNRLPYPPPKEDKSRGTVVVDYKTPLCFERVRRCRANSERKASFSLPQLPGTPLPFVATTPWTTTFDIGIAHSQWSNWEKEVFHAHLTLKKEKGVAIGHTESDQFFQELTILQNRLKLFCSKLNENEMDVDRLLASSTDEKENIKKNNLPNHPEGKFITFLPPVSPLGCDFLSALLTPFPEERLGVRDALQHPWLRECVEAI